MMELIDIQRITGNNKNQERLINNAVTACKNAESNWAKDYWFNVWKTLCTKFGRSDLYRKDLH